MNGDRRNVVLEILKNIQQIISTIELELSDKSIAEGREKWGIRFGTIFAYELTEGDFDELQASLDEYRDLISQTDLLEESHKDRGCSKGAP